MTNRFEGETDSIVLSSDRQADAGYGVRAVRVRRRSTGPGRAALEHARLLMLVMLNVAQLWILAATVEAALARKLQQIWPLVIASGVCWLISISVILWWKPASRRYTSTGYIRERK
jgi:hypothetical protein